MNKTDITIVLDRSGSMLSVLDDAVNGFNQFIEDQKKVEGEATVTLVQFDTVHEVVYKARNLKMCLHLTCSQGVLRPCLTLLGRLLLKSENISRP